MYGWEDRRYQGRYDEYGNYQDNCNEYRHYDHRQQDWKMPDYRDSSLNSDKLSQDLYIANLATQQAIWQYKLNQMGPKGWTAVAFWVGVFLLAILFS